MAVRPRRRRLVPNLLSPLRFPVLVPPCLMGSRVLLSDSDLSAAPVTSRAPPPPPLRSVVVAPAGHQLGSRGWDVGAGPSRAPASPPSRPATTAAAQNLWRVSESRWARPARRAQEQQRRVRQVFPASRPPGGNPRQIPAALHGCCYNCGQEGHISAMCTNETLCAHCGGTEHTTTDCKRPRSLPEPSPPRLPPPSLRAAPRDFAVDAGPAMLAAAPVFAVVRT
ncbi:hypothetical protein QYE76_054778 [Lolium multiflorum]|uniref:CCHC-type domain-containing protein n=1 Tax=Lolium multiflorum TaxID=4521 RepID=A0AAD8SYZ0_LOLMU|nr:hypothetical protein QYE76_054778 [Lolium multiflorum]